jgi:two-component system sensor histidine kinase KdpD
MGALGLKPADPDRLLIPDQLRLLEALAQQSALALEVDRLSHEAQRREVEIEAERLRSALLSSVSHDLRTPLAAITGAASSLLEQGAPLSEASRRDLLQTIYEEADRLGLHVANLLEMTRLQAGQLTVRKELQPLEETIGSACRRLERQLKGRQVNITLPPGLPLVPADAVLLEHVFFNLIENATKYTPAGSPLEISAHVQGPAVVVEVSDHGPGLGEGEEERIFDKFYRGQARGSSGGAGLGLAICKGVVEAHGGRIWAQNRPDGGAVFRFTLPLGPRPPDAAPPAPQPEAGQQEC